MKLLWPEEGIEEHHKVGTILWTNSYWKNEEIWSVDTNSLLQLLYIQWLNGQYKKDFKSKPLNTTVAK